MRALVIGLGSIGLRHAKVLTNLGFQVDAVTLRNDTSFSSFQNLSQVKDINVYSYLVVSSETHKHSEILNEITNLNFLGKVLIEKPLNIGDLKINNLSERTFIGYNLRFLSSFEVIKEIISDDKIQIVDSYAGSDLRTWRTPNAVCESYSLYKSKGGGVLKDLSHEVDYVSWLFGKLKPLYAKGGRFSNVTVDSDDAWNIICESDIVPQVTIRLNYLDKLNTRQLRVVTDKDTYLVDINANTISTSSSFVYRGPDKISDTYMKMHSQVLSEDQSELLATFNQGREVDAFIDECINFNFGNNA